jgi:hypothetical protein
LHALDRDHGAEIVRVKQQIESIEGMIGDVDKHRHEILSAIAASVATIHAALEWVSATLRFKVQEISWEIETINIRTEPTEAPHNKFLAPEGPKLRLGSHPGAFLSAAGFTLIGGGFFSAVFAFPIGCVGYVINGTVGGPLSGHPSYPTMFWGGLYFGLALTFPVAIFKGLKEVRKEQKVDTERHMGGALRAYNDALNAEKDKFDGEQFREHNAYLERVSQFHRYIQLEEKKKGCEATLAQVKVVLHGGGNQLA